jgi:carbamoyltransferase
MGLASYGTPFDFDFESYSDDIKHKMNVAATIQDLFEKDVLHHINQIDNKTDNLCLSGGSFLNCNANSKIVKNSKFKNFHHFPACGDDGTSVGSALYVSHHILNLPRHNYESQDLCYTGKDYESQTPDYEFIAKQLASGKIIGWFQGRSEFGPRALGNRSILADPRNFHNRELINHVVKNREWFRPFAPVVLEESYQDWFDFPIPSPYMLYTAQVKQPEKIPAVTHIDGSSRFQTINEKTNPHYYNLIKAFKDLTGVPVLLNTSLNGNGQPILETEDEAEEFFKNSNLDLMIINGTIL